LLVFLFLFVEINAGLKETFFVILILHELLDLLQVHIGLLNIEFGRIELPSCPVLHFAILGTLFLFHHLQKMSISGNPSTVLGRTIPSPGSTHRVEGIYIKGQYLLYQDLVLPVIPEVISISDFLRTADKHLLQGNGDRKSTRLNS